MKVKFIFVVMTLVCCDICSSVVVTEFAELENLYYSRKLKATNNKDKEEDPFVDAKEGIKENECKELFNAKYFIYKGLEEYADKNTEEVYETILKTGLRKFHYIMKNKKGPEIFENFKPYYSYKHEYELTLSKIGKKVYQKMFPCLAITRFSRTLIHYYLAYGFAAGERFLFEHSPRDGSLMIKALVELTPVLVQFDTNMKLQEFYIKQRETAETNPLLTNKPDPICNLKDYEKLRLCSLVFDVEYYKKTVRFVGNSAEVDFTCKNRKVTLDKTLGKKFEAKMIGCIVSTDNFSQPVLKYRISQAFNGGASVFVFRPVVSPEKVTIPLLNNKEKFVLDAYIKSLTVLMEQPDEEIFFDVECCPNSSSESVEVK